MKKSKKNFGLIFFLMTILMIVCLGLPKSIQATGPSYANIEMVPIACNDRGAVLFKTFYYVNPTGGSSFYKNEFGWLVVSENGLWKETVYASVDRDGQKDEELFKKADILIKDFEKDFDWSSPPKTVQPLLARYGFSRRDAVAKTRGAGIVKWTPTEICYTNECKKNTVSQRSLKKLNNISGEGSSVSSSFYCAGVALFRNVQEDEPEKSLGAVFEIPTEHEEYRDGGIDFWTIDGISIIKK